MLTGMRIAAVPVVVLLLLFPGGWPVPWREFALCWPEPLIFWTVFWPGGTGS